MGSLKVKIINPDKVVFEGEAEFIMAPSRKGMLGILPSHTPMFAELTEGDLIVHGSKEETIPVTSGMLKVLGDVVTILIGSQPDEKK